MKIAVTGANQSLGKNIADTLESTHEVLRLGNRIETYTNNICDIVGECDVFINCGHKDKVQSDLFEDVFNLWKYKKKTIVNILTSALIFDGPNKKYIEDKRYLESKTFEVRSFDKEVRIINVYPNTLENTQIGAFQKLKFGEVSSLIKMIIELPHDIEIFQIGISKTKLKSEISII